jgi:hypothetical protein
MTMQVLSRQSLAALANNRSIGQFPIGEGGKIGTTSHCLCDLIGKSNADQVLTIAKEAGVRVVAVPRSDRVVAVIGYSSSDQKAYCLHDGNCNEGFDLEVFRAKPNNVNEIGIYKPPYRKRRN